MKSKICKYYTIYKLINKINNKIYIGKHKTNDLNDGYLGSGKIILKALSKYGKENFSKEYLFIFDSEDEMNAKEREIVNEDFITREDTYNLVLGGHGGGREPGYKPSKETMNKIAIANKKHWKEHPISKERSEQYSIEIKNRYKNDPQLKIKISNASKENWKNEKYREKVLNALKKWREQTGGLTEEQLNKLRVPHSKEWTEKISQSLKGKHKTLEHKKHLSEARKGKIRIINISTKQFKYINLNDSIPDGYVLTPSGIKKLQEFQNKDS